MHCFIIVKNKVYSSTYFDRHKDQSIHTQRFFCESESGNKGINNKELQHCIATYVVMALYQPAESFNSYSHVKMNRIHNYNILERFKKRTLHRKTRD